MSDCEWGMINKLTAEWNIYWLETDKKQHVDRLNMIETVIVKVRGRKVVRLTFLYFRISNHRSCLWFSSVDIRTATEERNIKTVAEGLNSSLDSTFISPLVTLFTTCINILNPAFRSHHIFMCFVWIPEDTAVISLYNINWLGFINKIESFLLRRTGVYLTITYSV